jgi:hypothetical protein
VYWLGAPFGCGRGGGSGISCFGGCTEAMAFTAEFVAF